MFITGEEWGMLKSRATIPTLSRYVTEFQEYLAKLPSPPRLEVRPDMAKMEDGKIVFIKQMNNQNAVSGGVRYAGGYEAAISALLYRITDDPKYLELAIQYMRVENEFCALSQRSRILPEWYHFSRLGMLVAYDWLHDKLTQEQRRELIGGRGDLSLGFFPLCHFLAVSYGHCEDSACKGGNADAKWIDFRRRKPHKSVDRYGNDKDAKVNYGSWYASFSVFLFPQP